MKLKELLLERNANRKVDGEDVKFDAAHLKDLREIIDIVRSEKNNIKLKTQQGDWEVSFDISNDAKMYAKIASMYNLNQFNIGTKGNVVTLSANPKSLKESSEVTEDTLRQAMAESGKTKATDLKNYIKRRFPDAPFTAKEITAIIKEFRETL